MVEPPAPRRGLVLGAASLVGARVVELLLGRGFTVVGADELRRGDLVHLERAAAHPSFRFELDVGAGPLPRDYTIVLDLTEASSPGTLESHAVERRARDLLAFARVEGAMALHVAAWTGSARRSAFEAVFEVRGAADLRSLLIEERSATGMRVGGDARSSSDPHLDALAEAIVEVALAGDRGSLARWCPIEGLRMDAASQPGRDVARCEEAVAEAARAHRLGDVMSAAEQLIAVSERLAAVHHKLVDASLRSATLTRLDAELRVLVASLGDAQSRHDPVGIADCLEYEALPLLGRCRIAIAALEASPNS